MKVNTHWLLIAYASYWQSCRQIAVGMPLPHDIHCRSQWFTGSMLACSVRGLRIEPALQTKFLCFSRKSLRYAALGTGCTHTAVPRSAQPSTLRGTVNEYQPCGWVIIPVAMGECLAYSSLQVDLKVEFAAWPTSWQCWLTFAQGTQSELLHMALRVIILLIIKIKQFCLPILHATTAWISRRHVATIVSLGGAASVFGGADIFQVLLYCYSLLAMSTVSVTKYIN